MTKNNFAKRLVCAVLALVLVFSMFALGTSAAEKNTEKNRFNVIIALDASGSMVDSDPNGYRYEAIKQFTGLLAEQGNVLGGVVFRTDIVAQKEPVLIKNQAGKDEVVKILSAPPAEKGWTNTGAGLEKSIEMLESKGDPNLPSVILWLSDGNTDMGNTKDTKKSLDLKAEAIQKAREKGISIYSICLNADGKADVSEMKQVADATDGIFQEVKKAEDLQQVFNAFYGKIYGTSTIDLGNMTFSESGNIEKVFEVPGIGVEEVNIIIYGATKDISVVDPNGSIHKPSVTKAKTYKLAKLTDIVPGKWKLTATGNPKDKIKINMVYNTNLGVEMEVNPNQKIINPADGITVKAYLNEAGNRASSASDYSGYKATVQIADEYGKVIKTAPMSVKGNCFEAECNFDEGIYNLHVLVEGNSLEKESNKFGPLKVTAKALSEAERNNTPPVPVENPVKDSVYIVPFKKHNTYTLDLNTLAKDKQDTKLKYQIVSSSFIANKDYTLDKNNILVVDNFSLSKGAFTIRAIDSNGLSCDVEVIVKSYNIGVMALIGIGVGILVALIVIGIILYIVLTKRFKGTITAMSYVDGRYQGCPRKPKMGICKLNAFNMADVGLDYNKAYFQATGENYIYLVTKQPVYCNGIQTKKICIHSGAEVTISANKGDPRLINVRFDSIIKRPMPHGGNKGNRRR